MKSLLLVPGDSMERCEAALDSGAHTLIVDLSAASFSLTTAGVARRVLDRSRASACRSRFVVMVGPVSGPVDAELDLAMTATPDAILLSGAVGGTDIQHLAAKLAVREAEHGIADGATDIFALVADTGRGVLALGSVAGASPRLAGLGWRTRLPPDGASSLNAPDSLARSLTSVTADAAGVDAIDAASPDLDRDVLARDCELARRDGFAAKLAITPSQVRVIDAA